MIDKTQQSVIILSGLFLTAITGLVFYSMTRKKKVYEKVATISKLIIYPIKSLPGIEVDHAQMTNYGLKHGNFRDRSWLLINNEGRFITQRQESSLALLSQKIASENELIVEGPNMTTLRIQLKNQLEDTDRVIEAKVWGQAIEGVDCGQEASDWFSKYLNKPGVRLIQHMPNFSLRPSGVEVNKKVEILKKYPIAYQDASGCLVINQNSIEDLNTRLPNDFKVSHRNFRPNILVSDCTMYGEDTWTYVSINHMKGKVLKPCDRCVLTTIDPDSGVRNNREPLETLKKFRLNPTYAKESTPTFGQNIGVESQGELSVGDEVYAVVDLNNSLLIPSNES